MRVGTVMLGKLRRGLVLCAPPLSKLLGFAGGTHLGLADRLLIHRLELVAEPLRLAQLVGVAGLDRFPVLVLPALPTLLRRLRGTFFGFPDRSGIFGFPPLPSLPGLAGNPLRELPGPPLRLP